MNTLNLTFFDCVSHGYLQVSWTDFVNIFKKYDYYPSECSYKGQGYVYLEEDCDAPEFIKVLKDEGVPYEVYEEFGGERMYDKIHNFSSF